MRTYSSGLKIASGVTLAFFLWSFGPVYPAISWAASPPEKGKRNAATDATTTPAKQRPEERFQTALEDIREKVNRSGEKADRGEDDTSERTAIRAKKSEVDSLADGLRNGFNETERKLKAAGLPKTILTRHADFVAHFERNVKELRDNLDGIETAKTKTDRRAKIEKARLHLEKTKAPSRHQKLDPENLPFRARKATKTREPRTKEQFEKDFPKQKHHGIKTAANPQDFLSADPRLDHSRTSLRRSTLINNVYGFKSAIRNPQSEINHKPILLASNGSLDGLLSSDSNLPRPLRERIEVRGGFDSAPFAVNDFTLNSELSTLNSPEYPAFTPNSELNTPNYQVAQATVTPPTADDLAETPEIQFTDAIRAKAQELGNDPVKIYNWVRNNIDYQAYYGSFKGASQTLAEGAGNDFDQASLLIALLRASNISAKYAYGTVEIPAEKAANIVGVSDPRTAATIYSTQGIPVKLMVAGGTVKAIQMERVWVEAWIDYFPSWGARHKQGAEDTWIPLDPSFKQYTYSKGMDMYALMEFDADQFLQSYITDTRDITTYQAFSSLLTNFIDTHYPDATIDQIFGASDIDSTRTIVKQEFPYLLGTLPYKTAVKAIEFSQVPLTKDFLINIQIEGNALDGIPGLNYSGYLSYLADKRVTVSYEPATTTDDVLVAQYGGNMLSVPPYLLNVKPVLRINGSIGATGASIGLGKEQTIVINFTGPDGDMDRIQNIITAGDYSAITLQSQSTPHETTSNNMQKLLVNIANSNSSDISLDDLLGQMLYSIGSSYFHRLNLENKIYSAVLQVVNLRQPAEAMITHRAKVNYLFDMPRATTEGGINVDVDRNINVVIPPAQDEERKKAFMILSGLSSSAWEHIVLEAFFDVSSVSTVRLLKLAATQGIPIYTIDVSNMNEVLPLIQIKANDKTDITDAVNAGKKVIVSKTEITQGNWTGVGYIILDPVTGAAAFQISGGLSGSECDYLPLSVREKSSFRELYWKTKLIRDRALTFARAYVGTPYWFGGKSLDGNGIDCSGFVFSVLEFKSADFPPGKASDQYARCESKDWLHPYEERMPGNIVWKTDLTHVGIEGGTYDIIWEGLPFHGETAIHASGRPCYPNAELAHGSTCIKSDCIPVDLMNPQWGGNPPCGDYMKVIEAPMIYFGNGSHKDKVCNPY